MSSFQPVRIVIVGCGMIAKSGYQPRCLNYKNKIELAGYFDQDKARAEDLQKTAGAGKVYAKLEDVFNDPNVEAVLNLTTIDGHYPVSLAALKAGKHVYSEKPVSITTAQANEAIREAESRNLKFGCAPSSPLGYEQQNVWSRIRAGEIGTPHTVVGSFSCTRLEYWHPNADVFMSNGLSVIADAAPYPLTMMTTYFGPVVRVSGFARILMPERELQTGPRAGTKFKATIPNHVMGLLEFENGVRGYIHTGWSGQSTVPALEIAGSDGSFLISPHNDGNGVKFLSAKSHESQPIPTPAKAMNNALDWGKGVADFADAIRTNRTPRCSAYQGRHIVEIAEKLNEASERGTSVALTTRFTPPEPVGEIAPWE
jgi:predicted dehydrogenase